MHPFRFSRLTLALGSVSIFASATPALAGTELVLDGHFRVRGRIYDNLQLQRAEDATADTENVSTFLYLQQRLRLEPELRVNQYLSVFSQLDVLPDLVWGSHPALTQGLTNYYDPVGLSQTFEIPTGANALALKRAWAELYTPYGRFKLGRTGMQVGAGVFFNDGNGADADYGDTADRIQFLTKIGPVFLLAGYDAVAEGALNTGYDASAFAAAVAYRSELVSTSLYAYLQNDRSWVDEGQTSASEDTQSTLTVLTLDAWAKAAVGPIDLELEAIYRYGSGRAVLPALDSSADPATVEGAVVNQFGGMARALYGTGPWNLGLELGLASGDPDEVGGASTSSTSSTQLTRFSFDRDYHVGMLLFRVPLPGCSTLQTEGAQVVCSDDALMDNAVSNAFYLLPTAEFKVLDNLSAKVSALAAWTLESGSLYNSASDYGYELNLGLQSLLYDRLTVQARGAMLIPGAVFGDSRELAFGGELSAFIKF